MNLDFNFGFEWHDENDIEGLSIPSNISKKHRTPLLEEMRLDVDPINWVTQKF